MTVTWGATTDFPNPSTLEESVDFVGGTGIMADGSMVIDLVARKQRVKLGWQSVTLLEANSLYAQAVNYNAAAMDMTNAGGMDYGDVVPIPNSARKVAQGGYPVVYDVNVEVRTVDPLTLIEVGESVMLGLTATLDAQGGEI